MDSTVNQIEWRVYYDLDEQAFVDHRKAAMASAGGRRRAGAAGPSIGHHESAKDPDPRYFPVRSLLNTAGFFEACRRLQEQVDGEHRQRWLDEADRLASAFRDYKLPLISIREADLESAVTVFARLNRTGRKMAADELVSALTYQEGEFNLAGRLNEFKAELKKKGFGSLDRIFLLRSVLAALELDIYAKDWADLMVKPAVRERLPEGFDAAARGIRLALEMLRGLGVTSDRLLPYGLQLVLLGEFYRICPKPSAGTVELLRRWFWVTSFTGWFGGVNTAQAKRALEEIRNLAEGKSETFNVVDLDMPAQPFPDRFDARSARVRAFLLYLASLRPRPLSGGADLEPGPLLSLLGTDAVGYVCSNPDPPELVSSPGNRLFVDEGHVGQALDALAKLDDEELRRLFPTHGFPIDCIGRLRNDDRPGLINARLVCCPGNAHRNMRHLVDDRLRRRDPGERRCRGIVAVDERLDLAHKVGDAAERAPLDCPLAQQAEPPLDLVQPGRVGGREVQVEAGPRRQPPPDLGVPVRRIVVQHEVDIQLRRHPPGRSTAGTPGTPRGGAASGTGRSPARWRCPGPQTAWSCRGGRSRECSLRRSPGPSAASAGCD